MNKPLKPLKPLKPIKRRLGRKPATSRPTKFHNTKLVLKKDYSIVQKPAELLSPKEQRLIEYYALGYTATKSEQLAGYEGSHGALAKKILGTSQAMAYFDELMEAYREKHFCTKEQIVRELVNRIPESSTKELVQLAQTLGKMLGFNEEQEADVKVAIEINWTEDPFVEARKENIIDVEIIEEEDDESNKANPTSSSD